MAKDIVNKKAKNIIESKILALARSDAGIYGQRFLIRLVQMTQQYVRGDNFDQVLKKNRIEVGPWGDALIRFPIRTILSGDDDKNHSQAKKALATLRKTTLEFEDDDVYETTSILGRATLFKHSGIAEILVMSTVWEAMLDFSKGYFQYDPDVAMRLTSEYALIIYKKLRGLKKPLRYRFETLRDELHLGDKYKRNADIIDKVLKVAKKELDAVSNISFEYTQYGKDYGAAKKGRKACIGVTITPIHLTRNDKTDEVVKSVDVTMLLSRDLRKLLQNKFEFDFGGIKANIPVFDAAVKQMGDDGYMDWLSSIAPSALRANSPQGYVVNATKQMLLKRYNISLSSEKPLKLETKMESKTEQANQEIPTVGTLFGNMLEDLK